MLAYNADVPPGNPNERLAYIGQDLYASGYAMGQRIVNLVGSGDVALFIATPGQLNIQPRIDGATAAIKKFGAGKIKTTAIATGALLPDEVAKIEAYYLGHKNLKGMFAVDAGSTQAVGQTVAKYELKSKGVKAGGYDLTPTTLKLIQAGQLDFTIDQQPYLQGWLPVLQLFFYRYSSGLVAPSNTNTGIVFVTKANVKPYLSTNDPLRGQLQSPEVPGLLTTGDRGRTSSPASRTAATRQLRLARCRVRSSAAARRASDSSCSARRLLLAEDGRVLRAGERTGDRRVLGADRDHRRGRGDAPDLWRDRPLSRECLRVLHLDLLLREPQLGSADLARGDRRVALGLARRARERGGHGRCRRALRSSRHSG